MASGEEVVGAWNWDVELPCATGWPPSLDHEECQCLRAYVNKLLDTFLGYAS